MKTKTLLIIGVIAFGLILFSQCKPKKMLVYNENGNYFVDNNFLIKDAKEMSRADIDGLIALDKEYTKFGGSGFLNYIVQTQIIQHVNQIKTLTRVSKIAKLNVIHKGCFDVIDINWNNYGDIKARLDNILSKYEYASLDGNIGIAGNKIVTKATKLSEQEISTFNKLSVVGIDENNICNDYMGTKAFSRLLMRTTRTPFDKNLNQQVINVIKQYQ
ncbi:MULTISPECIES: hypothetical protein [Flavobacterium]|jgi:hypothetical protein|uniref:Uncharacterized protein n=1 Tax=Flavobacterium salmonis TaxID=2654844 RepID=A0A6V6Z657_9FLAO|nr:MULTISPECIES: hypothetical protein [Flavobacterium]CAD0007261.1 hypothetical protein FLAT13_03741 [Flavobacterium salmonis]